LDLKAMRRAQRPPGKDYQVAPSGVTLPWSVLDLAERPEEYTEWLDHIGDALPFLRKVSARQREDDLHAYLEVEYDTGVTVKSIGLSDGTWALLALSVLPFLNNVPPLVTVEEPENGIHPKAVETVLESLANLRKSQVLITTHSPVVVAVTPPEQLLCMRQNRSGSVEVIPGPQHPQLKDWQGTPSLATLLSAGIL
jgi:predicted ATPase